MSQFNRRDSLKSLAALALRDHARRMERRSRARRSR